MHNLDTARRALELVSRLGVEEFCLCGGSRNAPFLAILGASPTRNYSFSDERSAAFFALGRSRATRQPVAVVTTSGTAVAELLPATIEAFYSGAPLVLITADRPRRYRGTGAPQAIEQKGIFGSYAQTVDLEAGIEIPEVDWCSSGPLHLNVAFDEPLIDGAIEPLSKPRSEERRAKSEETSRFSLLAPRSSEVQEALDHWKNPLVILGGLEAEDHEGVRRFALQLRAPVYAEPLSGLREDVTLRSLLAQSGERILHRGEFDGVLRIGAVPTLRFWRDLDESLRSLPVVSLSRLPFPGLSRGALVHGEIAASLQALHSVPERAQPRFHERDQQMAQRVAELIESDPGSEPAMIRTLSKKLPAGSHLYLGNSLPIREWDLAAIRSVPFDYSANRGANGIDGQLSTFLGLCRTDVPNWCLVGDLTAMYDLSAPWIASQLDQRIEFQIVILNNGGGRIFSRVASLRPIDEPVRDRYIESAHQFHFEQWAGMWGLPYQRALPAPSRGRGVIELVPDAEATRRFWQSYDKLWSTS